jgi:hypothetical protein
LPHQQDLTFHTVHADQVGLGVFSVSIALRIPENPLVSEQKTACATVEQAPRWHVFPVNSLNQAGKHANPAELRSMGGSAVSPENVSTGTTVIAVAQVNRKRKTKPKVVSRRRKLPFAQAIWFTQQVPHTKQPYGIG